MKNSIQQEINQGIIEFNHFEEDFTEDHAEWINAAQDIVDAEDIIEHIWDNMTGWETEEEMDEIVAEIAAIRKVAYHQ